jgi:hypothetical protein
MMYFVGLQLTGAEAEYEALYATLRSLGPWSNRLNATWIVESTLTARRIRDLVKPSLKPADRLLIGRFDKSWSATNMGEGFAEWMERRDFGAPPPPPAKE